METKASIEDFAPVVEKDAVCLYYRSNDLYVDGSQEAEDLCDEIQQLEIALASYMGRPLDIANDKDRSNIVLAALRFSRDYTQGLLENQMLDAGEL